MNDSSFGQLYIDRCVLKGVIGAAIGYVQVSSYFGAYQLSIRSAFLNIRIAEAPGLQQTLVKYESWILKCNRAKTRLSSRRWYVVIINGVKTRKVLSQRVFFFVNIC